MVCLSLVEPFVIVLEDDVVKQAFATQQKRFRMYIEEMAKQKLDLDTSEASVKNYFQLREKIREK